MQDQVDTGLYTDIHATKICNHNPCIINFSNEKDAKDFHVENPHWKIFGFWHNQWVRIYADRYI